jgi:hypothetical protein
MENQKLSEIKAIENQQLRKLRLFKVELLQFAIKKNFESSLIEQLKQEINEYTSQIGDDYAKYI